MDIKTIINLKPMDVISFNDEIMDIIKVNPGYTYCGGTKINIDSVLVYNRKTDDTELISSEELVNVHFKLQPNIKSKYASMMIDMERFSDIYIRIDDIVDQYCKENDFSYNEDKADDSAGNYTKEELKFLVADAIEFGYKKAIEKYNI